MPRLSVSPDGTITAIYSDELQDLNARGEVSIERASSVEPGEGGWIVQMRDGMEFGPFRLRSEALAVEVAYLEGKLFGVMAPDEIKFGSKAT